MSLCCDPTGPVCTICGQRKERGRKVYDFRRKDHASLCTPLAGICDDCWDIGWRWNPETFGLQRLLVEVTP